MSLRGFGREGGPKCYIVFGGIVQELFIFPYLSFTANFAEYGSVVTDAASPGLNYIDKRSE